MQIEKFDDFTVYQMEDSNIFIHINISKECFYSNFINYFFSESNILNYVENKTSLKFNGTSEQFVSLYKSLSGFIDDENLEIDINDLKKELKDYIDCSTCSDSDILKFRKDKMGKVGEFIFHNILCDYFSFSCILPKLQLLTNKNMSIYGIDTIFWNPQNEMLLFGESKVSKSIINGVSLINTSLKKYEHQIFEEFRTVLSSKLLPLNIPESMKSYINKSIDFTKFIEIANIKRIGIPIFIMHGTEVKVDFIQEELLKIDKIKILNLEVVYYIISVPVVDKDTLQAKIIEILREKCDYYESNCK